MKRSAWPWAVAAAAWLAGALLGRSFIAASSATYDEPVHLASGYSALRARPLNWRDHPPLAEMWDALPLLALRPAALPQAQAALKLYDFADVFLYKNTVDARRMLDAARLWSLASWLLIIVAVVTAWAGALGGPVAAAAAAVCAGLMPPLISNAALVTTDAAPAALFSLSFWLLSRPKRPLWLWVAAGAALGLSLASKFSLFVAPGFAAAALLTEARLPGSPRARPAQAAALSAACLAALWLVYSRWGLSLYFEGLRGTLTRLDQGRAAFLAGQRRLTGFALYFPAALLLKTPTAPLLLAAGAALAWLRRPSRDAFWVLFPAAAFFALTFFSRTQIGYRHLLPVYPALCVAAGWAFSRLWERGVPGKAAAALLLAWQAVSVCRAAPDLLAYFCEAAGGPAAGHRWLVDSNLDWGQALPALAEEVKRRGGPAIYLSYFGVADPSYEGLRYLPVGWVTNVARRDGVARPPAEPVLLAVSATNLEGAYYQQTDAWAWLKNRVPAAVPGQAIFLYDLTRDADGRKRLAGMVAAAGYPDAARRLLQ